MRNGRFNRPWRILALFAMLLLAGTAAFADVPSAPWLNGVVTQNPDGSKQVGLTWYDADSGQGVPDGFYVYRAIEQNGQYSFSRIATVTDTTRRRTYSYVVPVTTEGDHAYYVTGFNDDGEGSASNTLYFEISLTAVIFTNPTGTLIDSTTEGALYSRNFDAMATTNDTVLYRLLHAPAGMTINSYTGVVSWNVPTSYNTSYTYTVEAYLPNDPAASATLFMYVMVAQNPASRCGLIYGTVYVDDSSNAPVPSGIISALPITGDSSRYPAITAQVTNGFYQMFLLPGTYKLEFSGSGYVSEWYLDASNALNATPLTISCIDTTVAHFLVTRYNQPEPEYDSVMGTVRRASDSTPVMALVYIYAIYGNDSLGSNDSLVAIVRTDSFGSYLMEVPANIPLVALAIPLDSNLRPQYYYLSDTRAGATLFRGGGSSINFFLEEEEPSYNNRISGTLMSPSRTPVNGVVTAYQIIEENGQTTLREAATVYTRLGMFGLANLEPGDYILLGVPADSGNDDDYAPGYFKENGLAAKEWDKGTVITIDADDQVDDLEFRLHKDNGKGKNRLSGNVGGSSGRTKLGGRDMAGATPLAGAVVFVLDANEEVSGSAVTDINGNYTITGLGVGTFTVLVDKVGYETSRQTVTFTEEEEAERTGVSTILEPQQSVSSAPQAPATRITASLFPNPVNAQATLRFNAAAGSARITIANATGSEVLVRSIEAVAGENTVTIETANLASGVYFLTLQQGSSVRSMPINIIR